MLVSLLTAKNKWGKVERSVVKCCKMGKLFVVLQRQRKDNRMASFIGEYTCKFDDKGRITFPANFRAAATGSDGAIRLVVQKDLQVPCLNLMTEAAWDKHEETFISKLNPFNVEHKKLRHMMFANMRKLEVDTAGRILLPKDLLEKAGIGKEVVFAGQGNTKIELWDKTLLQSTRQSNEATAGAALEKFLGNISLE